MDWKSSGECAQLTDADVVTLYGKQKGVNCVAAGGGGFGAVGTCWKPAAWQLAACCSW